MNQPVHQTDGLNKISAAAFRLLDALLLRNPERTAIGVALGLGIAGIFNVFQPLVIARGIHIGALDWWAALCLGLALVHLPFIIWSIRHKPLISDELESLIKLVESTNIGELEKRSAYRRIVNKCIDEFSLSAKPGAIKSTLKEAIEGAHEQTE